MSATTEICGHTIQHGASGLVTHDLISLAAAHLRRKPSDFRRQKLLAAGLPADDRESLAAWLATAEAQAAAAAKQQRQASREALEDAREAGATLLGDVLADRAGLASREELAAIADQQAAAARQSGLTLAEREALEQAESAIGRREAELDAEEAQADADAQADTAAQAVRSLCTLVDDALGASLDWRGLGSRYTEWRGLTIRVSDHPQPAHGSYRVRDLGGIEWGDRDLADVSFLATRDWTREEIRRAVAAKAKASRTAL